MTKAFRAFPDEGLVAIFDEATGGGDILDINSQRNRPALNPAAWLDHVYFHSTLDNMEVFSDTTVVIAHSAIAAATSSMDGSVSAQQLYDLAGAQTDWDVGTHSLGYEPLVLVAVGTNMLSPGYPVQVPASTNGSVRYITPYVTTSKVFLHEFQSRGATTLSATSISYRILVFKRIPTASGDQLANFNHLTGVLRLGLDRFDSSRRYLQVVPGGTPFGLVGGRTIDLKNGAYRIARSDGTTYNPIPSTVKQGIYATGGEFSTDTLTYGVSMDYTGTFTPSTIIQVQAP